MRYRYSIGGIFALVLTPIAALPQYAHLNYPDNLTIPATNFTGVPPGFPFVIEGCGAYTRLMIKVLSLAGTALTPALDDVTNVKLGLNSKHGFRALFKDGATSTYVRGILRSIASAQPLTGLKPDPSVPTAPRFACVTPSTTSQYDFLNFDVWFYCNQLGVGVAFYVGGASYIFLCPHFWQYEIAPRKKTCPSVRYNQFLGRGDPLSLYLTYMVIHEMVHFYLGWDSLGPNSDPPEVYSINDCVGLDSLNSVHNPSNYHFYVALAEQGCTEAPDPDRPPFSRGEAKGTLAIVLPIDAANNRSSLAAVV